MARPKRNAGKAKAQGGSNEMKDKGKAPAKASTTRSTGVRKQPVRLTRSKVAGLKVAPHILDTPSDHEKGPENVGSGTKSGDAMDWTPDDINKNNGRGEHAAEGSDKASIGSSEDSNFWGRTLDTDEPEEQVPLPSQAKRNSYRTVQRELESLKKQIRKFVNEYYTFSISDSERYRTVKAMLQKMSPDLRRYISCIARGGSKGAESWMELLCDNGLQRVLLAGIIGRVLVEQVFMSLYFGADEDQEEVIRMTELDSLLNTNDDAFQRAKKRAQLIEVYEWQEPRPPNFEKACSELTLKLQTLLDPLLEVNSTYRDNEQKVIGCTKRLLAIVSSAAEIAHAIRADETSFYHFKHIIKGDKFDPVHHTAINLRGAQDNKPEPDSQYTQLLCALIMFPECIMYRPGGGDGDGEEKNMQTKKQKQKQKQKQKPKRKTKQKEQQDKTGNGESNAEVGYRSRLVSKGDVLVRWGKESSIVCAHKAKGKSLTDGEGGFIEFEDLQEEDIPMTWMDRGRETCAPQ